MTRSLGLSSSSCPGAGCGGGRVAMCSDFSVSERVGQPVYIDALDARPCRLDRVWWHLLPTSWACAVFTRAADGGEEFDGLYCGWCYGPGYVASREDQNG